MRLAVQLDRDQARRSRPATVIAAVPVCRSRSPADGERALAFGGRFFVAPADLSLAQIERGTRRPSFEVIFVLARVLNVSAMSFFVFEREENDAKALRRKTDRLLRALPVGHLGETYRFLKFVVGR